MQFFKKFLFISFIFLLQLKSAYAEILLGNWILSNPVVSGQTSTWSAITKDSSFKSDVSISPSSIQVANHLSKNRLSELVINAVTQAIPDGTDFIIDSSSQQLKYNLKADNHNTSQYKYTSPFEYGDVYTLTQAQESLRRDLNEYPGQGNYFITGCVDFEYKYECYFGHKGEESDPKARSVFFSQTTNDTYDSNAKPQTTSLVNVATKVVDLADQNNSSAVSYIAYVVKDLIQYDANYRIDLENQLNSKLKISSMIKGIQKDKKFRKYLECRSGIRNQNGDCWICSRESHDYIRGRVVDAKEVTEQLAGCVNKNGNTKGMNSSQLLTRYRAYTELGSARDTENACWYPTDQNHINEAIAAKKSAAECNALLRQLSK